jgi:hypothetical protein
MGLDGIAGRALGQRLNVRRERNDRAAANDNDCRRPAELARARGGDKAPALARTGHHAATTPNSIANDTSRPATE